MSVYAAYFSPTNSTEKIVKLIANEFSSYRQIDLSKNGKEFHQNFAQDDVVIIGVPSYGGRVPAIALERISGFKGNGAKAVLVVAYGNRAYDDTVRELADCAADRGFRCVAAVTAVAEHSIMHKFAAGRPDDADKKELAKFAQRIRAKIEDDAANDELKLPGNRPYREYKGLPLKPKAGKQCTNCGACVKACPVGAISPDNPRKTDTSRCISCMRCIKVCHSNARKVNSLLVNIASQKMKSVCQTRKDNELFI